MKDFRRIYGCPGCGDITTGTRSPRELYDCCPDCIERATDIGNKYFGGDDDQGPFEDAGLFPPCPKCRSQHTSMVPCESELECLDCTHHWTPIGVYTDVDAKLAGQALSRRRWRKRRAA